jgi:hypothetical protein
VGVPGHPFLLLAETSLPGPTVDPTIRDRFGQTDASLGCQEPTAPFDDLPAGVKVVAAGAVMGKVVIQVT